MTEHAAQSNLGSGNHFFHNNIGRFLIHETTIMVKGASLELKVTMLILIVTVTQTIEH